MTKIDLIIDYLDSIGEVTFASQGFAGVERLDAALAAAREIKALHPVGHIVGGIDGRGSYITRLMRTAPFPPVGTKLYSLDEVTK